MKAHRRNGIPTLMLQEGGAPSTRSGGLASGAMVQATEKSRVQLFLKTGSLAAASGEEPMPHDRIVPIRS
jgi:hypothetical protein